MLVKNALFDTVCLNERKSRSVPIASMVKVNRIILCMIFFGSDYMKFSEKVDMAYLFFRDIFFSGRRI